MYLTFFLQIELKVEKAELKDRYLELNRSLSAEPARRLERPWSDYMGSEEERLEKRLLQLDSKVAALGSQEHWASSHPTPLSGSFQGFYQPRYFRTRWE